MFAIEVRQAGWGDFPLADFIPSSSFLAFLLASLVLAVVPGPGVLYIVTRSMTQGRASGLVSVVGVAMGNLGNAVGAAFGLAALFAASSFAFAVARYAGAAYLIYLGIKTLRSSHAEPVNLEMSGSTSPSRVFRDGFTVALLNPKTALFFAAYLPQFLPMSKEPMVQTLVLGFIFILIAAITDCAYALAAGTLKPWLTKERRRRNFGHKLAGSVYIGLGLFTAFTTHRMKNHSR
jgi:threonine/homoserine/homoserine lactone efflux protein